MNRCTTNTNSMNRPTTAYNDAKAWWRQQYRSCRDAHGHSAATNALKCRGGEASGKLTCSLEALIPAPLRPLCPILRGEIKTGHPRCRSLPVVFLPGESTSPGGTPEPTLGESAELVLYIFFSLFWRVPAASASPGQVLLQAHHSLAVSRWTSRPCGAVIFWLDCISTRLFFTEYCERCIVKRVYLCSLFVFILSLFIHFSRLNDYTLIDKIIFISIPALKT